MNHTMQVKWDTWLSDPLVYTSGFQPFSCSNPFCNTI